MVPLAFRLQVGCPRASRNMWFCMVPPVRVNDFRYITILKPLLFQATLMVFTVPPQSGGHLYACLLPCPMVCASFCMHFYYRILWSVLRFVCIFTRIAEIYENKLLRQNIRSSNV